MNNPKGTIVSLVDCAGVLHATIDVDISAYCSRCAAGKGCGAGVIGAGNGNRQIQVPVDERLDLVAGDTVELSLAPENILRATLIVYGIPMLGAVAAATIAYVLSLGDAAAAVAALLGLGSGLLVGRWRLRQTRCLRQFVPAVEKSH